MFILKLCVSITTGFLHCNHCSFLVTNASVVISFNLSNLKSTNIDYESTFWMDKFVILIDNQITNVSCLEITPSYICIYFILLC